MRLLLNAQVFLWGGSGSRPTEAKWRAAIEDSANEVLVSTALSGKQHQVRGRRPGGRSNAAAGKPLYQLDRLSRGYVATCVDSMPTAAARLPEPAEPYRLLAALSKRPRLVVHGLIWSPARLA